MSDLTGYCELGFFVRSCGAKHIVDRAVVREITGLEKQLADATRREPTGMHCHKCKGTIYSNDGLMQDFHLYPDKSFHPMCLVTLRAEKAEQQLAEAKKGSWKCPECGTKMVCCDKAGVEALKRLAQQDTPE